MGEVIVRMDPLQAGGRFDLKRKENRDAHLMRRLANGWLDIGPQVTARLDEALAFGLVGGRHDPRLKVADGIVHDFGKARAVFGLLLPGWWYRLGQCHLSTDIALGPDHGDPAHAARLHHKYPEALWDGGFDFDIRPPIGEAPALVFGMLAVLQRQADLAARDGEAAHG